MCVRLAGTAFPLVAGRQARSGAANTLDMSRTRPSVAPGNGLTDTSARYLVYVVAFLGRHAFALASIQTDGANWLRIRSWDRHVHNSHCVDSVVPRHERSRKRGKRPPTVRSNRFGCVSWQDLSLIASPTVASIRGTRPKGHNLVVGASCGDVGATPGQAVGASLAEYDRRVSGAGRRCSLYGGEAPACSSSGGRLPRVSGGKRHDLSVKRSHRQRLAVVRQTAGQRLF